MVQEERETIVSNLLSILSEAKIKEEGTITQILSEFIYSIGSSLESNPKISSLEEIEIRYGEQPTLGNALMAQAIWMRDTWVSEDPEKERKQNVRSRKNVTRNKRRSSKTRRS